MTRRGRRLLAAALIALLLFWCAPHSPYLLMGWITLHPGHVIFAQRDLGASQRFSALERWMATNYAYSYVFGHSGTLERVWYDEQRSIREFGELDTNRMAIYCDFRLSDRVSYAGWAQGERHSGYCLWLRRLNRFCPWYIADSGYA